MTKRICLAILFLGVVTVAAGAFSSGRDSHAGPSDRALVESWSSFETILEGRIKKLNESDKPGTHRSAYLDVISSDLIRSPSLKHPIVGILDIQAQFTEDRRVNILIPRGTLSQQVGRTVLYRLTMVPKDGHWSFADGVATMVWTVDDGFNHPGEKARLDLEMPTSGFGMDLIALLLDDGEKKSDSKTNNTSAE